MEWLAGQNREHPQIERGTLPAMLSRWRRRAIPEEDFHRLGLAYAITVHKAQGSQFKRVIMPAVTSRLLDRTLIYTALTRGMEQVVFIGDRDAFNAAVIAPLAPTSGRLAFRSDPLVRNGRSAGRSTCSQRSP